jgi:hypothetical protein
MPDSTLGLVTFLAVLCIAAAIWYSVWYYRRGKALLQRWAEENDLQIVTAEYRWLRLGPFFWTTSRGQTVYYVTVMDTAGRTRRGYIRCGSFWWGLFSDEVAVRWDDANNL